MFLTETTSWAPEVIAEAHRIVCRAKWAPCPGWHTSTAAVKDCFRKAAEGAQGAWPCSWLIQVHGEDGPFGVECGAPTRATDGRGSYECERGHSHVPAEVRQAQGWEYAECIDEAKALAKAGVRPVQLDGKAWL